MCSHSPDANVTRHNGHGGAPGVSRQPRAVEIRTTAGPSRHVQWVLRSGPYTVASQVRQVQVVCPPPCPRPLDTGASRPTSWLAWRIENPFLSEEESGFSAITEAPLGSASFPSTTLATTQQQESTMRSMHGYVFVTDVKRVTVTGLRISSLASMMNGPR